MSDLYKEKPWVESISALYALSWGIFVAGCVALYHMYLFWRNLFRGAPDR